MFRHFARTIGEGQLPLPQTDAMIASARALAGEEQAATLGAAGGAAAGERGTGGEHAAVGSPNECLDQQELQRVVEAAG